MSKWDKHVYAIYQKTSGLMSYGKYWKAAGTK